MNAAGCLTFTGRLLIGLLHVIAICAGAISVKRRHSWNRARTWKPSNLRRPATQRAPTHPEMS